eukprot:8181581-Pyramimonas_sp.AAC.1
MATSRFVLVRSVPRWAALSLMATACAAVAASAVISKRFRLGAQSSTPASLLGLTPLRRRARGRYRS